jgi:hypothetical protein
LEAAANNFYNKFITFCLLKFDATPVVWNTGVLFLPSSFAGDSTGYAAKVYTSATHVSGVLELETRDLPNNISPAALDSGAPSLITRDVMHVRSGPGNQYPSLGKVGIGTIIAVVGISPDKDYYVLNVPTELNQSGQGWIQARFVRAENVSNVPVVQPPPAP